MEENNYKPQNKFWAVIIVAAIFGLLAGFLAQTASALYFFSDYGLSLATGKGDLISKKERAAYLGQFFDYQLTEEQNQSLVGLYLKKKTSPAKTDVLSQAYLPSELQGQGIILTGDGWILTSQSVVAGLKVGQLVVVFEQKPYEVDKLLVDAASHGVFIHAVKKDSRNWPVAKLISRPEDLQTGQAVLALNNQGEIVTSNIKNLNYRVVTKAGDLVQSSELFSADILIKDELEKNYLGGPVINLSGEVIGLVAGTKPAEGTMVIPLAHLQNLVGSALQGQKIKRPYLGVDYLDLSWLAGVEQIGGLNESQAKRGALVFNLAVNGPAIKAGLLKGDIILKVDGEQVNRQKSLTDLIQEYQPGETVKILFLRNGLDKEATAVLGEQ